MRKSRKLTALLLSIFVIVGIVASAVPSANAATSLLWPVPGHFALSRGYSSSHGAMDIHDSTINGANIVAAMGGTVVRISKCTVQHYGEECSCGGTGTGVVIKGTDNRYYSYAHMTAGSIPSSFVANKTTVEAGDFIGKVGTTGNSSGPHLHFSIATGKNYLDNRINPEYETYTNVGKTAFTFSCLSSKMSVTDTDAVIAVSLSKPANNRLVRYGATVYDESGVVLGSVSADSSGQVGTAKPELWWTVSTSMGITLKPGRTYQFSFWANVSGVTLASAKYSFTTTGTATDLYNISYDANGGSNAPAAQTKTHGTALTLSTQIPVKEGYTFLGWATSNSAASAKYQPGASFTVNADTTLYAVWEKNCSIGHTYDNDLDASCNICGNVRLVIDPNLLFVSDPGLSFQEYIGLQVMFKNSVAEDYDKFYVEISQMTPDGAVTVKSSGMPVGTYTIFEQQIVSWSMTEPVTMTLYAEKDGVIYKGASFTTTVKDLAMEKLKEYYADLDIIACRALVDMLNYGAAVQTAYNYNASDLANADLGKYAALGTTGTPAMSATNNITGTNKINVYGNNISMQDKVEFQFMVDTAALADKTVVATLNGKAADVVCNQYGDRTIIRVAVAAAHMRDTYSIVINDANGNPVTATYNVSVEAYAKNQIGGAKADVIIAMMRYGDSVAAIG